MSQLSDPHPSPDEATRGLHLAVFGWVQQDAGSVASAHFLLCRSMLADGHALDFFADPSFIPDPGFADPAFSYVPVPVDLPDSITPSGLPVAVRAFVERMHGMRRGFRMGRNGVIIAGSRHARRPYDAMLFLGTPPLASLDGVPAIVWPQSAPQNELGAVRELADPISRLAGRGAYLRLRAYYEVKDRLIWRWARHHRLILCSPAARASAVAFGAPEDRVCVAPYPIDRERFAPGDPPRDLPQRVLCIGRLDPRKRVDLLVDAVAALAARRDGFRVEVIGRDGYLPGWASYVQTAESRLPITYTPAVRQSEIITRLRGADLVVQPSQQEEFGHAVAEALACGVPTLTGPTNGVNHYLPDLEAMTFDRYEPECLASAMDRALDLARDRRRRHACRAASEAFDAGRVASTVLGFLRSAVEGPGCPAT